MMGLASGMDTDFIIQQTLRLHQFKIDNQMRNKKLIEWRQQTHNTIKDEISNLRSTFLSNLGSKTMMNRNAFTSTVATVSGARSSAVSIRTNAGTPLGNFSINSVTQLARGAHLTTVGNLTGINGNGFATGTRISEMEFAGGEKISFTHTGGTVRVGNENIKIENNGGTLSFKNANGEDLAAEQISRDGNRITITAGGSSRTLTWDGANNFTEDRVGLFNGTITASPVGGGDPRTITVTANQNQSTGEWSFATNIEGATVSFEEGVVRVTVPSAEEGGEDEVFNLGTWHGDTQTLGTTSFSPVQQPAMTMVGEAVLTFNTGGEDVKITIRETDTISEVMNRINNSSAGVSMTYDRLSDRFTLESRRSNNAEQDKTSLTLNSGGSNFFNLISGTGATTIGLSQNAQVKINGETITSNTNSFDFRGVGITLHSTFAEVIDEESGLNINEVNVNLRRDTDRAFNAIKEFIDNYNNIIKRLEGLLTERKTSNETGYKPLTDEEKQGMSDKQIEEWEAIARKGIFRGDQGIQNLVSNLRRSFFDEIEGLGITPASIGLTTGSYFDGTGGQIMINEERLREAIERDPDMVADVFIRIDNSTGSPQGKGLLHKIDGLMRDYVNESQSTSMKNLESSLKRANEQIARMQERMFAEEDRLYRQFAAMESAMSKLQQQGDWFSSMLG